MPENLAPSRYLIMTIIAVGCALLSVPRSWSNGIDWDGALLEPNGFQPGQSHSGNQSNLPGVNTRNPTGNSVRPRCNEDLQLYDNSGSSARTETNCNRNTRPLLRFQGGQVDGILFEFPR